ncbi:unnamed protein product [Cladocopium goreaui]|uniref:TLC domain-containing protein n=1 Tax=Cladocopium goreaui TaxID=2562237 RepID=A0A9P1GA91_9DINO|nr:unnamed protein product [Cladocopium goreaui]
MRSDLRCFYILYAARYIQAAVTVLLEPKRKDFLEMMVHHIVTIGVVYVSYFCGWNRVGVVVMVLLDPADVPLHLAKLCKYTSEALEMNIWQFFADRLFEFFAVLFFVTRLVMFGYVCWSAHIESEQYFHLDYAAKLCVLLLYLLMVLQLYWFGLILKVAMKLLRGQGAEDIRSDDEDEDPKRLGWLSRSEQLKERYTELSKDLELAQEKAGTHECISNIVARTHLSTTAVHQSGSLAETTLTLLEQQRAEVKRFQDLKAQKEALIVEAALFRLYCADRDATKNLEEAQQVREELSKTEHDLRKRRKALEASEVRRQKLETEVREAESDHFALNAALEQRKPEIANCRKQAAHWTIKEREAQARIHQEQEKMKTLEAEWHDATAKREAAEKELADVRRRKVDSALKLTAAQRRECHGLPRSLWR